MDVAGHGSAYARVTPESFDGLERHDWPGNVRELRNLVTVALAYDKGGKIDLAAHISDPTPARRSAPRGRRVAKPLQSDRSYAESKDEHDRLFFAALHEATGGNVSAMSKRAKVTRETVRAHLGAHRIGTYELAPRR
jgi:DNA-binding NtrC family response regulator